MSRKEGKQNHSILHAKRDDILRCPGHPEQPREAACQNRSHNDSNDNHIKNDHTKKPPRLSHVALAHQVGYLSAPAGTKHEPHSIHHQKKRGHIVNRSQGIYSQKI